MTYATHLKLPPRTKCKAAGQPAFLLRELITCALITLLPSLTAANSVGAEWRVIDQALTREGIELRLVIEPNVSGTGFYSAEKGRMEVRELNGTFSYHPFGASYPYKTLTLATNDKAEAAALLKLAGAFVNAYQDSQNENKFRSAAKSYSGKLGPVRDCEMSFGQFILFEKKDANGQRFQIDEPSGLLWLLNNPSIFKEVRATLAQATADAQAAEEKARAEQLLAAKQEAEARLKNIEQQKRNALLIESQNEKLGEIAKWEQAQRLDIEGRIEAEAREKLQIFTASASGQVLLKEIADAEAAGARERGARKLALQAKLQPLLDEYARLLNAARFSETRTDVRLVNDALVLNQNQREAILKEAGNIDATPFDSRIADLKKQFEQQSKFKYEAAMELLKRSTPEITK